MRYHNSITRINALLLGLLLSSPATLAGTITYYYPDAQGNPIAATDAQGNILWREHYEPYGRKVNKPCQDPCADAGDYEDIGHTGHEHDAETGLTYMQARYQDPIGGRFYGIDPVGFNPNAPMTFNRYSYANNNPYKYIDPDGEDVATFFRVANSGNGAMYANALNASAIARSNPANDPGVQAYQCAGSYSCRQAALNDGATGAASVALGGLVFGQAEIAIPAGIASSALGLVAYGDKLVHGDATTSDHFIAAVSATPWGKLGGALGLSDEVVEKIVLGEHFLDVVTSVQGSAEAHENQEKDDHNMMPEPPVFPERLPWEERMRDLITLGGDF